MKIKNKDEVKKFYADQCKGAVGARLVAVRPMTDQEIINFGWDPSYDESAIVLIFDNGHALIPAKDPELNGPGFIEYVDLIRDR